MEQIKLPAPAKINLFLHINHQQDDGYHEIQTLFQLTDYCDQLQFSVRKDGKIHVNAEIPGLAASNNLVMQAAKLMQQHDKKRRGVDIILEKNIPIGAGLGGGSSNAATTILGLNVLWDLQIPEEQLLQLGSQIGADVPVFIKGKSCWAEGIGNQLTAMKLPNSVFLVVIPPVSVPTAEIFFDKALKRDTAKLERSLDLIETGKNDCQPVVISRYPEVGEALDWLSQFASAKMTGTGSCVFARFENEEKAEQILHKLPKHLKGFITFGLNESPLLTALRANL